MLSSVSFLRSAYRKNANFHKQLATKYEKIGKGHFMVVYYDKENDRVIKAFNLAVLKHPKHSITIADDAPEFFYNVCAPVAHDNELLKEELLKYIFKTNYDWGIYCRDNHHKYTHLPVVYSVDLYPEYYSYVIVSERLYSNKYFEDKKMSSFFNKYCINLHTYFHDSGFSFEDTFSSGVLNYKSSTKYRYTFEKESFHSLLTDMKINFVDFKPDFHLGNILFRIEDELPKVILTDPFY